MIRHKDSGKCVSKKDDSHLTLTDCVGDRKIFCYDSGSRFVKLQDDENTCVTIESNNLVLRKCNEGENMKWLYTEGGFIKKDADTSLCWQYSDSDDCMIVDSKKETEKFYFHFIKSEG